jgi:hypothetical protein
VHVLLAIAICPAIGKRFALVKRWSIIPFATLAWVQAEHFYMQERMPLSW